MNGYGIIFSGDVVWDSYLFIIWKFVFFSQVIESVIIVCICYNDIVIIGFWAIDNIIKQIKYKLFDCLIIGIFKGFKWKWVKVGFCKIYIYIEFIGNYIINYFSCVVNII